MYRIIYRLILGFMVFGVPLVVYSQSSNSLNTFSPYTFYGIGDLHQAGTTSSRSMGGIGVAYWTPFEVNLLNPAAYSNARPQSAVLSFGVAGKNNYLKTDQAKTANNTFSFNDAAFMLPLAKNTGLAVSVSPYSSVGYTTYYEETDPDIINDVGHVVYNFSGDGNISRLKAGVGTRLFGNLSVGVDFVAYLGTISRNSVMQISSVTTDTYRNIVETNKEEIGDISFDAGFQYDIIRDPKRVFTVGATYQPEVSMKNKKVQQIYTPSSTDSLYYNAYRSKMKLPQRIAAGVYYQTPKFGIGLDYSYQDWSDAFGLSEENGVTLKETQNFNFGVKYTPDPMDSRRFLNRWTYRAGFRFSDMYMRIDGQNIQDKAVTLGVGIPLRSGNPSELNVGLEFGRRGKTGMTPNGKPLVREDYFRVSLGITLFDNSWFMKYKYE